MKKLMTVMTLMMSPLVLLAEAGAVSEGTVEVPHEALILGLVVLVAKVVANFIEIKPTDKPWVKMVKKAVNILGGAISEKTGK